MNVRALAAAFLSAGCLLLVNVLAARVPLRLDLTEGRLFTLSPGSRRILASLPGPVEARVYFSETVEPRTAASRAYLRALLADARRASRGKLSVVTVDVDKDPQAKDEALQAGIAPVQFNVVSQEKFEVRDGFMGLSLRHADRREVIPVILDPSGLEHELVSRLARLGAAAKPVVGFA
ncbi:MAG: ABC transporter, partial [Elusimicrobia bacterium]